MSTAAGILIELFKYNHENVHLQLNGVTHDESLRQLPFRGNCMNWVVGHLVGVYGEILEMIDLPGTLTKEEYEIYGYGSQPLTGPAKAIRLEVLMQRMDEGLERMAAAVGRLSPAELEREVKIWVGAVSLIEAMYYMQWHAFYHTGQLEPLRQLAGKNDKVI